MKILAIGDLHGKLPKGIPKKADLILLAGDLGKADIMRKQAFRKVENPDYSPSNKEVKRGYMQAYNSTLYVLNKLRKIAPVYLVYGNVESTDSETRKLMKEIRLKLPLLGRAIKRLDDVQNISGRVKNLEGVSIAGYDYFIERNWVKRFRGNDREKLEDSKKEEMKARGFFKELGYVEILLVHQPPYKVLDKVTSKFAPRKWKGKHAGSEIILSYIKRRSPRYVICGHMHEAAGERKLGRTKVINLGECNYKILEV